MREQDSLPEVRWEQQVIASCYERARCLEELVNSAVNEKTAHALFNETMPEIERDFPFYGQPVYMSGKGIHPIFDEEKTAVLGEVWQFSEGDTGFHRGFVLARDEEAEDTRYQIMHKLHVGESHSTPYTVIEQETKVYRYFMLNSQLVPVIELEAVLSSYEFSDIEPNDRLHIVNDYSRDFVNMLRSTTFRRLQHKRQQRVVDDFLLEAERKASVRDLQFIGEPDRGYLPIVAGNKRYFSQVNLEDILVTGTCLGIDTVETGILRQKAIRRDTDLGDKWCGLCLVIDPDQATRDYLHLNDEQVLYIPTYDQTFDAELYEGTD